MTLILFLSGQEQYKGKWRELFVHPERPLYMELGTGKGRFIAGMAEAYPDANFVGFEVQIGVIYYAAQKIFEAERDNAKVSLFDIAGIEEIVAPGEVDRFYINFCDPWPKAKHAKRRLTYHTFLDRYARLLKMVVRFTLKLITKVCLCSLLKSLKNADGNLKM